MDDPVRYVYGDAQSSSLDLARAAKCMEIAEISDVRLPPDYDSNFLAYIQQHPDLRRQLVADQFVTQSLPFPFHFQSIPSPLQDSYDSDSESEAQSEVSYMLDLLDERG